MISVFLSPFAEGHGHKSCYLTSCSPRCGLISWPVSTDLEETLSNKDRSCQPYILDQALSYGRGKDYGFWMVISSRILDPWKLNLSLTGSLQTATWPRRVQQVCYARQLENITMLVRVLAQLLVENLQTQSRWRDTNNPRPHCRRPGYNAIWQHSRPAILCRSGAALANQHRQFEYKSQIVVWV